MKDRVVQFPHRYKAVPVPGTTDIYDLVAVPGVVTEEGMDLSKGNLLADPTAIALGLMGDPTINDALYRLLIGVSGKVIVWYRDTATGKGVTGIETTINGTAYHTNNQGAIFLDAVLGQSYTVTTAPAIGYAMPEALTFTVGDSLPFYTIDMVRGSGQMEVRASKTVYVPDFITPDIFVVGGGGGGGAATIYSSDARYFVAIGGAGGNTATVHSATAKELVISIGAGGVGADANRGNAATAGGTTAVIDGSGRTVASAAGGSYGTGDTNLNYATKHKGANGGTASAPFDDSTMNGLSNGASSTSASGSSYNGVGQDTTTRAFGETGGALYSGSGGGVYVRTKTDYTFSTYRVGEGGAGGGGAGVAQQGTSGTVALKGGNGSFPGGGGGGATYQKWSSGVTVSYVKGGDGADGICIIRW